MRLVRAQCPKDTDLPPPFDDLRRQEVEDSRQRHGDHQKLDRVSEDEGAVHHPLVIREGLWHG